MEQINKFTARMKAFADEVVRSAYDLTWYREVRRSRKLANSVKYILKLQVLVVLFYAGVALTFLVPLPAVISKQVADRVPDETFFEVKDGKFDTNLPEDWSVKEGADFKIDADPGYEGLNPPDIEEKSWVFFGRDAIFTHDDRGIRTIEYKDLDDFSTTKEEAVVWINDKLLGVLLFFLFIGIFVGYAVTLLLYGSIVGVWTLAASAVSNLMKVNISLERWFVMGFRMLTLPILVVTLLWLMGVTIPFGFSVLYVMVALAILLDERSNPLAADGKGPSSSGKDSGNENAGDDEDKVSDSDDKAK